MPSVPPMLPEVYRFALDHAAESVVITDPAVIILYVNPAFTRVTGYSSGEVMGRKPSVQGSPLTPREYYEEMWKSIVSQGWWRGEIVNRRKSGEEWHASLSISRVTNPLGETVAYVSISVDITELKQLHMQVKAANLDAITMLSMACEAKDETTGRHVARVHHYSEAIALKLGLSRNDAEEIGYSSIMHDLGKLHVPDAILMKPGPLSEEEWVTMRRHAHGGAVILSDRPFYGVARQIAECHHEKWDGTGYPAGKRGEEIPLSARITAVADVFDALSNRRPYKEPWPEAEALDEMRRLRGKSFDPKVVDAFLDLCREGVIGNIRAQFP